jgi:hypothetical protein
MPLKPFSSRKNAPKGYCYRELYDKFLPFIEKNLRWHKDVLFDVFLMPNTINIIMTMKRRPFFLSLFALTMLLGCSKDDVNTVILRSVEYQLSSVDGSGVTGTATFTEDSNKTTEVLIELTGTTTSVHPAFLRYNASAEGGPVALTLKSCECSVGHTVVSKLDDGTPISYDGLLKLDGHIAIHKSPTEMGTIVATANIGANGQQ